MTQPPQGPWSDPSPQPGPPPYGPDRRLHGYPPGPHWAGQPGAGGKPTLDQPHYGIGSVSAVKRALKKYARFDGRASRSEYWWWTLAANVVVYTIIIPTVIVAQVTSPDGGETPGAAAAPLFILLLLVLLALALPNLAVLVRRLHDAGFSGWLVLLGLIPSLGGLVLVVLCVLPSNPAGARFDRPAAHGPG